MKKIILKFKKKYSNLNVVIKAGMWFTICSILQKGISVITLPIFTRIMTTEQYGQYSIFQTWYNIFIIIVTLNIHSEIFNKGLSDNEECRDKFTSNQAGLLLILAIVFTIIYLIFHDAINTFTGLTIGLVLIMMLEIIANALIGLWTSRKKFEFDYKKIVVLTLIMSILNPIIGIIAVYMAENKAVARIISNAIIPIIIALWISFEFRKKGKFFNNFDWWGKSISLSIPLVPHYLSLVLLNQSDKLMINYFGASSQTGIYSVAYSAGMLMTIINNSINSSFVPWCYNKLRNKQESKINNISATLFFVVLLANLLLIWFAPETIKILADDSYRDAIWCLVPVAASVFFYFVYMLFVDIEIYYGANKYITTASIFAAILNIVLNYIFIPRFGYLSAGYTTLISYFMTMVLHYIFMKKTLKKNKIFIEVFNKKLIALMSIILIATSALAMIIYDYLIIRLIIVVVIISVLYFKKEKIIASIKELKCI